MEKRIIELPNGNSLEIEYTPMFENAVREGLAVPIGKDITNEDIREFVYKSFKHSLDNVEKSEIIEETLPTEFSS